MCNSCKCKPPAGGRHGDNIWKACNNIMASGDVVRCVVLNRQTVFLHKDCGDKFDAYLPTWRIGALMGDNVYQTTSKTLTLEQNGIKLTWTALRDDGSAIGFVAEKQ